MAFKAFKPSVRPLLAITLLAFLTACSSVYTSPAVNKENDLVSIIPLTPFAVTQANKSSYQPRRLPAAFKSSTPIQGVTPIALNLPQTVEQLPDFPATVQTSVPPSEPVKPYRIGVADVLLLATPAPSDAEALTGLIAAQNKRNGYTVQDDGAIAIPDVGRVELAGLTMAEAENAIFQALVNKQVDPKFSLEIAEFRSQKVSIAGAVNSPKVTTIQLKPLTLQEALGVAGGLSTNDLESAVVRINREGKTYQIPVQELRTKTSLQKIPLKDGDNVFVDQDYRIDRARAYAQEKLALVQARNQARSMELSRQQSDNSARLAKSEEARNNFLRQLELGAIKRDYVYLAGEVNEQSRFPLPFDNHATLADALYSKGGISTDKGDPGEIYLLRMNGEQAWRRVTAFHVDGGDPINLLIATKLELRPDDIIFVAEQRVTAWNRVVSKLLPTLSVANSATN